MKDLKSLLAAFAIAVIFGAAAPAFAEHHEAKDGKKMEKHDHKEGEHKDDGKHAGHKDGDDHKDKDGHDHDKEKSGKSDVTGKGQ